MIFCQKIVEKKCNNKTNVYNSNLLKTGIIISIGLTIHNLPEGLAIGAGFGASQKLGIGLAIAICIHDFPEGISMAIPLKQGGIKKSNVILYTAISGISTRNWCFNWIFNWKYIYSNDWFFSFFCCSVQCFI
jgi:ZIP family zinc transporter